jgi:hypothetical protein
MCQGGDDGEGVVVIVIDAAEAEAEAEVAHFVVVDITGTAQHATQHCGQTRDAHIWHMYKLLST